jgi:hypothetical protein
MAFSGFKSLTRVSKVQKSSYNSGYSVDSYSSQEDCGDREQSYIFKLILIYSLQIWIQTFFTPSQFIEINFGPISYFKAYIFKSSSQFYKS